uniref:Presequence protease, mitochondrial n=1 Tax=Arcella intermedia TaxID=1963864 RepID=A0A6B2KXD1_9EUKA
MKEYQVNDVVHDYKLVNKKFYPDRNQTAYQFLHLKTNAQHVHIASEDTNNVCMTTFKTSPEDSTGVAHVLEHTALCGSKKYPIRDPFFNMIKRSLQTYMNAWTGPDFTSYPFSTENEKDFYNLFSVYLDAAYFPNLDRWDFLQEGHRLEFQDPNDPNSPLEFKGIVFNEMKGAMSDASNLFSQRLTEQLYPTTTYKHNSGGDPEKITELTWEQLKKFHATHYHPSNSYTCTYGDLPIENHLKFINETVMQKFSQIDPHTEVPDEKRLTEPQTAQATCPPPPMGGDTEKQTKVAMAFLLNLNKDIFTTTAMSLLSSLLISGPNSPMYKSLIESNIGSAYAPSSGYDPSPRETYFSIGLQGIKDEDVDLVQQKILQVLQSAYKEGFDPERIEALLHQIEIANRHVTSEFGLHASAALSHSWIHGGSPIDALSVLEVTKKLREEVKKGPFFQNMIKEYFLDNPHRVVLIMKPDENYTNKLIENEKKKLEEIRASLTEEQKEKIVEEAAILKKRQEEKQDPSILPSIKIEDIAKIKPKTSIIHHSINSVPTLIIPQPTNGLTYFRALIDLQDLPPHLLPFVPLFTQIWTNIGSKDMDYRQISQNIEKYAGSFSASNYVLMHPTEPEKWSPRISVLSSALDENLDKTFHLWEQLFNSPLFNDTDRLRTLLLGIESDFQDSLIDNGHSYARMTAASFLSPSHKLVEEWEGITQYKLLAQLVEEDNIDIIIQSLQEIAKHVIDKNLMKVALNTEQKLLASATTKLESFLNAIPGEKIRPKKEYISSKQEKQEIHKLFIGNPSNINHNALCYSTVPYTHPDYPTLQVLAHLMTNTYLHREIREKGGAYGGGARHYSGLMAFYSYRDPNVLPTLKHFEDAVENMVTGNFTEENINEAKLNVFAAMDRPIAPFEQGMNYFQHDITHEMRQTNRNRLFDVNRSALIASAYKYLSGAESACAVFGSNQNRHLFENSNDWKYTE